MRDAGATAAEEMAYTLANGLAYVDELRSRGGDVEKFAKRLSFFFYVHMDFFDEIAKFRAGRRLWARFMKERYGVKDPKAQHFRFGVVCGGSSLVAPQPYNNVVRVAIETMAAVFGGAQSIFTCAFDEAFQIPTEFSAELAVRTQQIIAYESGIGRTVDPLGGSYFVEQHTDRMEEMITKVMSEIDAYGGVDPGDRGRLDAAAAGRARPGAQARHRLRQERRSSARTSSRRPTSRSAWAMSSRSIPTVAAARPGEIPARARHPAAIGGGCLAGASWPLPPPRIARTSCPTWSTAATPTPRWARW